MVKSHIASGRRKKKCPSCLNSNANAGRAPDGRRAYQCCACGKVWTDGLQGRRIRYSAQRRTYQFSFTGASARGQL